MTMSTCAPEIEQGRHVFEIMGYSKHRGMGHEHGNFIRSRIFSVGGHNWSIRFYPDGYLKADENHISVYLELMDKAKVRASCDLRLVDQSTGLSVSVHKTDPRMFISGCSKFAPQTCLFKKRSELEPSVYIKDDRLIIECVVTVFKEPRVFETKSCPKIQVPPSDIGKHLGKLLETERGADLTISVGGQTFVAHKFVLAMRSPVFGAQLYGPMKEAREQCIAIEGMQPSVFKALLHFIYTDSLPEMDDLEAGDRSELIRHMLVAADRYAMDRLNLMCQSILCDDLNVENVVTILALADQHQCDMLKDACIEFMSSCSMGAVVGTKGFMDLKRSCPSILVDAFDKIIRRKLI